MDSDVVGTYNCVLAHILKIWHIYRDFGTYMDGIGSYNFRGENK
jgi:hypothetical protein